MADMQLEDFYQGFYQDALTDFQVDKDASKAQIFTQKIGSYLEQDGDVADITWSEYIQSDIEFAGYAYDEERKLLTIIGSQFFPGEQIETLTKDMYERKFKKMKLFFEETVNTSSPLYSIMSPTDEAVESTKYIYELFYSGKIQRIMFLIITNGTLTRNTKVIPFETIKGLRADFQVFDLKDIHRISTQENNLQEIEVSISDYTDKGLLCLPASLEAQDYASYLVVMPGDILAQIYDQYGQKLLEQNVRTFLQFKGNTNKKMQITIKEEPERFFAYNNGLTCTASSIEVEKQDNVLKIVRLNGLQIVNGGQTTSVIYNCYKNKLDIKNIFVQMKLSVVSKEEEYADFVGKVARYANSQNPVKESDFFSNSPFHKTFKELSERIWAPMSGGQQIKNKWYYERTRGQYLNEKAKYTRDGKEKEFMLRYPKEQMVDKHLLAKTEMIFSNSPYLSTKTNQAFPKFAKQIEEMLEKDNLSINEAYFKETIAKIILTNKTDNLIKNAEWAKSRKSVRAYIKAYALAILYKYVKEQNSYLNYADIWNRQDVSEDLEKVLNICINTIREYIESQENEADLREKFSREYTWKEIQQLIFNIPDYLFDAITTARETVKYEKKEAKKQQAIDNTIERQSFVVTLPFGVWGKLVTFYNENRAFCGFKEFEILSKMAKGYLLPPSEKQAQILYELYEKAKNMGVKI
ncbi:MAG: abortive phage infection protein [Alphaproteobacteria bacterium]|nr:abortive phage infection protein [Alphaproteobacteria bacterium]